MSKKTSILLFNHVSEKIRLADLNTGTQGVAGIYSMSRPATVSSPAKYSTVGLILDKIFLDKSIIAYESDESVYTVFNDNGITYHACYDGDEVRYIGEAPKEDSYISLIPLLIYSLSAANKMSNNYDELKGYFQNIKNEENIKEAVLLFCDAFYYGFNIEEQHQFVKNNSNAISEEIMKKAISAGVFTPIELLAGYTSVLDIEETNTWNPIENKEVEYHIPYDFWTEEELQKIPKKEMLDTYVETPQTESIARKIKFRLDRVIKRINSGVEGIEAIKGDYINLLLVGRPATGKTTLANAVAAMTGLPIYEIPFSKNTEEDTIEGKNKVVNGQIDFVETEFLKAFEHGGIIVCEEINLADPAVVMGSLGQAIEYPFIVMKDGYKPVKRHPLCVIIGTMNTGTAGSKLLNQALSSRFKCTYVLDDPDKRTFIDILASRGFAKNDCKYVYEAYTKIMEFLKDPKNNQESLCDNITLRGCFGALECMQEGDDAKTALVNTLVGKIAEVDLEAARNVKDNVIDSFKELSSRRKR